MKRAVLLVAHGSRIADSARALERVLERLRTKNPDVLFQASFLELQSPSIPDGIELCIDQGVDEVIVVPYFVQSGRHVVEDIPKIVSESQAHHSGKTIRLAEYLGFDERIVSLVEDRVQEAGG